MKITVNRFLLTCCGWVIGLCLISASLCAQIFPNRYQRESKDISQREQFEFSEFSSEKAGLFLSLEEALQEPIERVKRLRISGQNLEKIPKKVLELSYLEELDLSFNRIKEIPADLNKLKYLKSLNLSHNQIEDNLIDSTFWQNTQLESLWLNHNQLQLIPEALGHLRQLRYLNLSHNQISFGSTSRGLNYLGFISPSPEVGLTYPKTFYHTVQANEVITQISKNYQISVPELMRLNQLEKPILKTGQVLKITIIINPFPTQQLGNGYWVAPSTQESRNFYSYNGLSHMGRLRKLEYLDLSYNQINYLPWSVIHLSRLKVLNLNHNQLKSLPWEIKGLKSLEYLFLSHNQLSFLPREIGKLENLQSLHLEYNYQQNVGTFWVPSEITKLKKLNRLHLSGNKMDEFPFYLSRLTSLKRLTLADANLYEIPPHIKNLSNLIELHFQENALVDLPPEIGELESLRKLYLQQNRLRKLSRHLNKLKNLDTINITGNDFEEIDYIPIQWLENFGSDFLALIPEHHMKQLINNPQGEALYQQLFSYYEAQPRMLARVCIYGAWWYQRNQQLEKALANAEKAEALLFQISQNSLPAVGSTFKLSRNSKPDPNPNDPYRTNTATVTFSNASLNSSGMIVYGANPETEALIFQAKAQKDFINRSKASFDSEVLARERANLARAEAERVQKVAIKNAQIAQKISVAAQIASEDAKKAGNRARKEAQKARSERKKAKEAQKEAEDAQQSLKELNYLIILGAILFVALALLGILILGYYARAMRQAKKKVEQQADELQDKNKALKASEQALEEKARQLQENNKALESLSEELRQQNDVVSQQRDNLAEKTYELEALTEELRQQNEIVQTQNKNLEELQTTKDLMISAVNHDLRNPLNALMNFSKPGYPGEEKELIHLIHNKSRRMEALIEDIMNVYRAEKLQINPEVHAPHRAIEEAIREIKDMLGQEEIPNIYNESDPGIMALFDYRSIERVFENFLTNAIKYTEEDGEIHFRSQVIQATSDQEMLRLSISDTGQGISKDKLSNIFEPFVNPNARSLGSAKSVGIGLTFCKTIVEAHQSQLQIDSIEGKGTTFYFDLPLVKKDASPKLESDEADIFKLSEASRAILMPYLDKLQKLDVEDYSEVEEVLAQIPESNPEIKSWKTELIQALDDLDEAYYHQLTQGNHEW